MWRRTAWGTKGRESPYSKGRDGLRCRIRHGKLARCLRWFAGETQTTPLLRGRPITRASKVRAAKFTKPKAWSSSRRGGFAARDSFKQDSGSHAGARIPCHTSSSGNHQSSESESRQSRDSDSPETFLKKSSSRWADRPIPVLQVKFPNPWRILADSPKNLKWSSLLRSIRTYFEGQ